jgi:hypothetical protein
MNAPAVAGAGQDSLESCEQEAICCLLDVFSSLTCTRVPRGRRYDLSSVLALALIGALAGCKNPNQIHVFG